jgi:hypothetical protein
VSEPATGGDATPPASPSPARASKPAPPAKAAAARRGKAAALEPVGAGSPVAAHPLLKRLGEYKEFIAIIFTAATGLWLAVDYFVTRERFAEVVILNQCQLFGNVAKLSQQINDNHFRYMNNWTFEQTAPYQNKKLQNIPLTMDEVRKMHELQTALEAIKKQLDASAASAKMFEEALNTGSCDRIINFKK